MDWRVSHHHVVKRELPLRFPELQSSAWLLRHSLSGRRCECRSRRFAHARHARRGHSGTLRLTWPGWTRWLICGLPHWQKILSSCWSDGQRRIRRPTGILLPRHSTLLWKSFGIVEFHVLKGNQSSKVFALAVDHR